MGFQKDSYSPLKVTIEVHTALPDEQAQNWGRVLRSETLPNEAAAFQDRPVIERLPDNPLTRGMNTQQLVEQTGNRKYQDFKTNTAYSVTSIDVLSNLMGLSITDSADKLFWHGEMTLYDPAVVETVISKLNWVSDVAGTTRSGLINIKFGTLDNDYERCPDYIGTVTHMRLNLTPQGGMLSLSLVSASQDLTAVNNSAYTSRIAIGKGGAGQEMTFYAAFNIIAKYAQWDVVVAEKSSVKIGQDFAMEENETYMAFAKRVLSDATSDDGSPCYFHVFTDSGTFFFGSAAYAKARGLVESGRENPSIQLLYGAPNSNVTEASIDYNTFAAAIYGAAKSRAAAYDMSASADSMYVVLDGSPTTLKTLEQVEDYRKKIQDSSRIISVPVKAGLTQDSTYNAIRAYLNSLRAAVITARLTLPGTHYIRTLDYVSFTYQVFPGAESLQSPVSGSYLVLGVQHSIDPEGGWSTVLDVTRTEAPSKQAEVSSTASVYTLPRGKTVQDLREQLLREADRQGRVITMEIERRESSLKIENFVKGRY